MSSGGETITIEIHGSFDLSPDEIWPDGVPDEWDIVSVVAAVKSARNVERLISEWGLTPGVSASIMRQNPEWAGDEVLFGDPPPRILTESSEVWR